MTATNSPAAQSGALVGCTVVYLNQLPHAAVLGSSFLRFHPEAAFAVLILDGTVDQAAVPNAKVLSLTDLGLDPGEEWRLPMLLSRRALRTYLEPVLIEVLSRSYGSPVAYFSAFTQIFGDLAAVLDLMQTTNSVVATEPIQNECGDSGRSFIGVPSGSSAALEAWLERSRDAAATNDGRLERLFDSVPHHVVQQSGFGIYYSNLNPASLDSSWDLLPTGGSGASVVRLSRVRSGETAPVEPIPWPAASNSFE